MHCLRQWGTRSSGTFLSLTSPSFVVKVSVCVCVCVSVCLSVCLSTIQETPCLYKLHCWHRSIKIGVAYLTSLPPSLPPHHSSSVWEATPEHPWKDDWEHEEGREHTATDPGAHQRSAEAPSGKLGVLGYLATTMAVAVHYVPSPSFSPSLILLPPFPLPPPLPSPPLPPSPLPPPPLNLFFLSSLIHLASGLHFKRDDEWGQRGGSEEERRAGEPSSWSSQNRSDLLQHVSTVVDRTVKHDNLQKNSNVCFFKTQLYLQQFWHKYTYSEVSCYRVTMAI